MYEQPTEVHEQMCAKCPSQYEDTDPESQDIFDSGDVEWIKESVFTCGWRPHKLCRGYYDKATEKIRQTCSVRLPNRNAI